MQTTEGESLELQCVDVAPLVSVSNSAVYMYVPTGFVEGRIRDEYENTIMRVA